METPLRVLAVDDEALICRSLERLLGHDYAFTGATDAAQALARIDAGERFDVILCDVSMPEMTGQEFHAELARSVPELAERVVFMTGDATALRSGLPACRLIAKPWDVRELQALVHDVATLGRPH